MESVGVFARGGCGPGKSHWLHQADVGSGHQRQLRRCGTWRIRAGRPTASERVDRLVWVGLVSSAQGRPAVRPRQTEGLLSVSTANW